MAGLAEAFQLYGIREDERMLLSPRAPGALRYAAAARWLSSDRGPKCGDTFVISKGGAPLLALIEGRSDDQGLPELIGLGRGMATGTDIPFIGFFDGERVSVFRLRSWENAEDVRRSRIDLAFGADGRAAALDRLACEVRSDGARVTPIAQRIADLIAEAALEATSNGVRRAAALNMAARALYHRFRSDKRMFPLQARAHLPPGIDELSEVSAFASMMRPYDGSTSGRTEGWAAIDFAPVPAVLYPHCLDLAAARLGLAPPPRELQAVEALVVEACRSGIHAFGPTLSVFDPSPMSGTVLSLCLRSLADEFGGRLGGRQDRDVRGIAARLGGAFADEAAVLIGDAAMSLAIGELDGMGDVWWWDSTTPAASYQADLCVSAGPLPSRDRRWPRRDGLFAFAMRADEPMRHSARGISETFEDGRVDAILIERDGISGPGCALVLGSAVPSGPADVASVLIDDRGGLTRFASAAAGAVPVPHDTLVGAPAVLQCLRLGGNPHLQLYLRIMEGGQPLIDALRRVAGAPGLTSGTGFERKSGTERAALEALLQPSRQGDLKELGNRPHPARLIRPADLGPPDPRGIALMRPGLFRGPQLIVRRQAARGALRLLAHVCDEDVVFPQSYFGYCFAEDTAEARRAVRAAALIVGSGVGAWLALVSGASLAAERRVEKGALDSIPVPVHALDQTAELDALWASVQSSQAQSDAVEAWVERAYRLRPPEVDLIREALRTRTDAISGGVDLAVFCHVLEHELGPWSRKFGSTIRVEALPPSSSSWSAVAVWNDRGRRGIPRPDWSGFFKHAAETGGAACVYRDFTSDALIIGQTNEVSRWTRTEARRLGRVVVWEHIGYLAGGYAEEAEGQTNGAT